jgi:hypothetical protein
MVPESVLSGEIPQEDGPTDQHTTFSPLWECEDISTSHIPEPVTGSAANPEINLKLVVSIYSDGFAWSATADRKRTLPGSAPLCSSHVLWNESICILIYIAYIYCIRLYEHPFLQSSFVSKCTWMHRVTSMGNKPLHMQ